MSWFLVDGVPVPEPITEYLALDFCNTRAGWGTATAKEYLTCDQALRAWARDRLTRPWAGALASVPTLGPELGSEPVAELNAVLALREALYPALIGDATADAPGHATERDWHLIATQAARARAHEQLLPAGGTPGPTRAQWKLGRPAPGVDLVALLALTAADILTSPLAGSVRACPGPGCGWLFADPRGRRRWCSMAVCGNRAKARRFARSAREAATPLPAAE